MRVNQNYLDDLDAKWTDFLSSARRRYPFKITITIASDVIDVIKDLSNLRKAVKSALECYNEQTRNALCKEIDYKE